MEIHEINKLKSRHTHIGNLIASEERRAKPDTLMIKTFKKEKLQIKDKLKAVIEAAEKL